MENCSGVTEYEYNIPNMGQDDEQNIEDCNNFMPWLVGFAQEFNGVFPKICAAANAGAMYLFKGEWGDDGVPTVFDAGWAVLKDGVYYASNVNNNSDVPPSSKWSVVSENDIRVAKTSTTNPDLYFGGKTILTNVNTPNDEYYFINTYKYNSSNPSYAQIGIVYPHSAGNTPRIIHRTKYQNEDWNEWSHMVSSETLDFSDAGERIEDYHELTLINQWTGSLKFTKFANGWVQVIGAPKNSSGESSYHHRKIGTLPAGYRPAVTQYMASPSSRWGYTCWCDIKTNGEIACDVVGNYYQYINFVYRAEN